MAFDLAIAMLLVLGNGFFVAVEFSLARVRPTQVAEAERAGRPGVRSLRHATQRIDAYLAACQLGITLCSLGLGAVGEPAFEHLLEPVLGEDARAGGIAVSVLVAFAIITLLHVVVGELSPKSLAIARTEPVALALMPIMRVFYVATRPLVDGFNALGNLLLKPFGIPPASEAGHAPHSEDELRELLRESGRRGAIAVEESLFGENVLLFGDRRAGEVMTPRPRVELLTTDMTYEDAVERVRSSPYTRLPLCRPEGGLDVAVGVVHAKDLLGGPAGDGGPGALERLARPLHRFADTTLIDEALRELRRRHEHAALVVDEHGTAVGLLTLEDVVEEILGEIEDEFDPDEPQLMRQEGDALVVDGSAPVREVAERLGVDVGEHHEATIGGLVVERLGRVPRPGERVELAGRAGEVLRAGEAVVERLRFERAPAIDDDGEAGEGDDADG